MKKLLLPLCAMLLCMTACQKEYEDVLFLDVEHYATDAKLHLDDAHYAVWDANDAIWFQTPSNLSGTSKQVTIQNNKACITGVSGDGPFTAIYPNLTTSPNNWHPQYSNGTYTITYPSTQVYRVNGDDKQVIEAPMAARCTDGSSLKFYNLGSVLAVNVTNNMGEEMRVHSIQVSAAESVKLSGTCSITFPDDDGRPTLSTPSGESGFNSVTLDCNQNTNNYGVSIASFATKTFYIALPPVTAKLTIKVYHDGSGTHHDQSQGSSHQLYANHGYNVPFAIGVPSNEIWYVTSDGQPVSGSWNVSTEGISVSSNTYSNGMGVIHLSGDVTSIPWACFGGTGCSTITKMILPASVKNIGKGAFGGCANLVSITMPGVEEIGERAFNGCNSLTSVELPISAHTIGAQAFEACASLQSVVMPNVQTILAYAFYNCTTLVSVTMPNVVTIDNGAFNNCSNTNFPSSLNLPNVTTIGDYAFEGCAALTTMDLGSGIRSIGISAFKDCTNLSTINCRATTPPSIGNNTYSPFENISSSAKLHVPQGTKDTYLSPSYWYLDGHFNESNTVDDL